MRKGNSLELEAFSSPGHHAYEVPGSSIQVSAYNPPEFTPATPADTHFRSACPSKSSILYENKFTVKEAAKIVGLSESGFRTRIIEDRIPVLLLGNKTILVESVLEKYLNDRFVFLEAPEQPVHTRRSIPKDLEDSEHFSLLRKMNK